MGKPDTAAQLFLVPWQAPFCLMGNSSCCKADILIVTKKLLENVFLWNMLASDQGTYFTGKIILPSLFYLFLTVLHSLQDLSSLTRDLIHAPCSGSREPNPLDCQRISNIRVLKKPHEL